MIIKNFANREFILKFRYDKKGKLITTTCILYPKEGVMSDSNKHIASINKSFEDQHNKAIARKYALTKLFDKYNISREDRKSFWKDYLAQVKV